MRVTPKFTTASRLLPAQQEPWFKLPEISYLERKAIVIGAGLAGSSCAYSLARRGWQVTIIDQAQPAIYTQDYRTATLYTKVFTEPNIQDEFHFQAFLYSNRHIKTLLAETTIAFGALEGVLYPAFNEKVSQQQHKLRAWLDNQAEHLSEIIDYLSPQQASKHANFSLPYPSLFFKTAGWVQVANFCQAQLTHPGIQTLYRTSVSQLEYDERLQQWSVLDTKQQVLAQAPVVILANGVHALQFSQTQHLPITTLRGQLTYVPTTSTSNRLTSVISLNQSLCPAYQGYHCLGATYHHKVHNTELSTADHITNLQTLQKYLPNFYRALAIGDITALSGWVGFRHTSPDYLPIIGPAPVYQEYKTIYRGLSTGKLKKLYPEGSYYSGLYLSLAHGSRGLSSAPFCGEILASQICNEPLPLPYHLQRAIHSARFIIKYLKQNKL